MTNLAKEARDKAQIAWPGASVHSRGQNWIRHQHPTEPGRFVLDSHIGPIHYGADQEIDTAWEASTLAPWLHQMVKAGFNVYVGPGTTDFDAGQIVRYVHPASGEDVTFQPQQLQWTNDLDQIEAIADPQTVSHTSIDDDTINWQGAYGAGLDFRWQSQTARLSKFLTIQSLAAIGSPAQFIIDGGNPVLRVPFIFEKSSNIDIYIDDVLWNEAGNNPQTTSGNVEFRLAATGAPLWRFKSPTVKHNPKDAPPLIQQRFRKQGASLFVEVLIPWTWLETASYPVEIDPTIDEQTAASSDDAGENNSGTMDLTNTIHNIWSSGSAYVGARFTSIALDGTETINADTYVSLQVSGFDDAYIDIYAEDVDDAATFTSTSNDISGRTSTTARTVMSATGIGLSWQNLDSIQAVIQEIIDRGGWGTGQDIAIILARNSGSADLAFFTYDSSTTDGPKLHIDYTAGGGDFSVNVSDSVTIGESVTVTIPDALAQSVSESVTIGESAIVALQIAVNVSDSATIAESVSVAIADALNVSVSDAVTIGEAVTLDVTRALAVSDSVTIGESVTVVIPDALQIGAADSVTIGEVVTLDVVRSLAVSDALTIGESNALIMSDLQISTLDGATIGEAVNVSVSTAGALDISVSDGVTIAESVTLAISTLVVSTSDSITIGESVNASIVAAGEISVNVSDSVTIGEAVTIDNTRAVSVAEAIAIAESVTIDNTRALSVTESVTIAESVNAAISDLALSVVDSLTIGESATAVLPDALALSVADSVTIGESVAALVSAEGVLNLSVSDGLTIGESLTVTLPDALQIAVSDGLAVGESANVTLVAVGTLTISVAESVTIGDSTNVTISTMAISVVEAVTIGESITVTRIEATSLSVTITDALTISEAVSIAPLLLSDISVSDGVTIVDSPVVSVAGTIFFVSVSDGVTIADAVTMAIFGIVPLERIFAIGVDNRIYPIDYDHRVYDVEYEDRTYPIILGD